MRRLRSRALLLVAAAVVLTLISGAGSGIARGQSTGAVTPRTSGALIHDYFAILNADLRSGNVSSLRTVYAADATLTLKDLKGVTTTYHGLAAIEGFWKGLSVKFPGLRYTEDHMLLLDTVHVATYEHASTFSKSLAGRCAHLFKVIKDRIVSDSYIAVPLHSTTMRLPTFSGNDYQW